MTFATDVLNFLTFGDVNLHHLGPHVRPWLNSGEGDPLVHGYDDEGGRDASRARILLGVEQRINNFSNIDLGFSTQ